MSFDDEKTDIRLDSRQESYPCLEVLTGPKGVGRYPLKSGKNSIGRSSENDIVLDDSSISRRHALIELGQQGATLADLESRNGTKLSGRKISQPVLLTHEAHIKMGIYELRYLSQPAQAQPAQVSETNLLVESEVPLPEAGAFPATQEISSASLSAVPAIPPKAEGVNPSTRDRKIAYLVLALVLIGALGFGGSRVLKFFTGNKKAKLETTGLENRGQVGGVLPGSPSPQPFISENPSSLQPVFLDISSSPLPAKLFFGDQQVGLSPLRISTNLKVGSWYEARALFELPEVGESLEEKNQFSVPEGASVIPLSFSAKIGIFKIASIPRDAQLYLEGYFEKDPYHAKPIKFSEIVFGKPLYVPYGRYILELRKNRQLGLSQTYLDEVVYRREFVINGDQTNYTADIKEETLSVFPITLSSVPSGAHVFIDDKDVGLTPYQGSFPVGEHLLVMKKEGYFDFTQMIKMAVNMPYVAEIPLKTSEAGEWINKADALLKEDRYAEALPLLVEAFSKRPSPQETAHISYMIGICYLRQKSLKEAKDYFAKSMAHDDFKYAGRLGIASVTFEEGDRVKSLQMLVEILVSSEDPKVRSDAGALFQKISPLNSVMYVTSDPAGARTFVNGVEMSQQTPLILHDLGVGSYRVQLRKEGYEESDIHVNLAVSEFRPLMVKLKKSN